MKKLITILFFICLIFPLKAFAIQDIVPQKLYAGLNITMRKYMLGPNDVISIYVQDFPSYDREKIRVQPDGNIIIAPFGIIHVSGRTVEELYSLLYKKYLTYFKKPEITIKLDKLKPSIVYITGAVITPGSYELLSDPDDNKQIQNSKQDSPIERKTPLLSNILVAAGGLKYDADLEHIKITNSMDNTIFEVNLLELLENGKTNQDIYLMPYDSIYVPSLPTPFAINQDKYTKYVTATFSPQKTPVKVLGYVNKPGLILLDNKQSLNLNSAISEAGGYSTDWVNPPKEVFLSRIDNNGKLITTKINPMNREIVLMPNDIVYVPEKPRTAIVKTFTNISRLIDPINLYANAYNNWALMYDPHRYQVIGK